VNVVLDAGVLIAWLRGEIGHEVLSERLDSAETTGESFFVYALNLCEVFYEYSRSDDVLTAQAVLSDTASQGVVRVELLDAPLCADASQIKAAWRRVRLADCFGLALARRMDAVFVTTDRHEMERLQSAGIGRIDFLR